MVGWCYSLNIFDYDTIIIEEQNRIIDWSIPELSILNKKHPHVKRFYDIFGVTWKEPLFICTSITKPKYVAIFTKDDNLTKQMLIERSFDQKRTTYEIILQTTIPSSTNNEFISKSLSIAKSCSGTGENCGSKT